MAVAAAWPADRPLLMLHSGRVHSRWARWSILASPAGTYRFDGRSRWEGPDGSAAPLDFAHEPMADLDRLLARTRLQTPSPELAGLPFTGGWIGYLSYDLGRHVEPAARHGAAHPGQTPPAWPLIELARCPHAFLYDHLERTWFEVGRSDWTLETAALSGDDDGHALDFATETLRPAIDPDAFVAAIARTIEYIAAGDIFQANITQRFAARFTGSTRGLWCKAAAAGGAWYGAYLELGDGAPGAPGAPGGAGEVRRLISVSPELFLHYDPVDRRVITRPVKGTRPAMADPLELRRSAKDEAELNMIIDLMRNDLGRVCRFGSVRVASPRAIESHPTVHHGVGEIHGRLRDEVTAGGLLRATFPAGSVTGAPKIRAMQIIEALEPMPRGPYCGAIGFFSDSGRLCLNVAIRTLVLSGRCDTSGGGGGGGGGFEGMLEYGAGGGIVADSEPLAEYRESLDKTAVLREALRGQPAFAAT